MAKEQLRFTADEFTGSDPLSKTFTFPEATPTLFRVINELDVQANSQVELTDGMDEGFDYPVRAGEFTTLGGTGDPADHEGGASSDMLSEPWERVRITVIPAAAPTAGHLTVRSATEGN